MHWRSTALYRSIRFAIWDEGPATERGMADKRKEGRSPRHGSRRLSELGSFSHSQGWGFCRLELVACPVSCQVDIYVSMITTCRPQLHTSFLWVLPQLRPQTRLTIVNPETRLAHTCPHLPAGSMQIVRTHRSLGMRWRVGPLVRSVSIFQVCEHRAHTKNT